MIIVYIGLAGAAGAMTRYAISLLMNPSTVLTLPWGTLTANLAGCFLISALLSCKRLEARPRLRTAMTTGFVGSFTTMSTLSAELFVLLQHQLWLTAGLYVTASWLGGLFMVHLGKSIKLFS
ncbi:fluoride efflux transporter CrcB [Paenibacillus silviterrae]|uniref:fluoride efflux transporter CrcB n=1 Tax=Paenibacillus silviterrae TaxID=3242194 RepID=UPI002543F529|nr:fluoride efflux transporter CrcB [Paenibacillus chinjuensis]